METDTVKRGSSSREIGSKRESFKALVNAYSLSPECKLSSEKVPIQPRKRWSLPIFQVTKRGLRKSIEMNQFCCGARRGNILQCWVGDAQVVRLNMAVKTMQFLVQDIEAEEAHFGNRDSLFNLIAIGVGMAIGVLMLVLVRGMSVLEWEELSACHRLGIWLFLSTFSLFQCGFSLWTSHSNQHNSRHNKTGYWLSVTLLNRTR